LLDSRGVTITLRDVGGRNPRQKAGNKMAKVAKKVQLKIVERENAFELVNAEVSKSKAEALVRQYEKAYRSGGFSGINVEIKVAA
jgi:hypothetical protein